MIIPEYIIDIKNKSKKTIEVFEHFERLKNLDKKNDDIRIIDFKEKKKFKNKKIYKKKKFFKKTK